MGGVTISSVSNIYGASAESMRELFADYVSGNDSSVILVIASTQPAASTQDALEKTFYALGFGHDACTYAQLLPVMPAEEAENPTSSTSSVDEPLALDPQALFLLVEGLDPICLVVCDTQAREALCATYRTTIEEDSPARIFGIQAAVFANLDALISTDDGKQKAWSILKLLPHRA